MGVAKGSTRIVLTIKTELKEKLEKQADKECRTTANLITTIITRYLGELEDEDTK